MSYAVRNDGRGWRAVHGPDDCAADETWQAEQPAPIAPPPPASVVTMRQARLALLGAGLLDDVEAALSAIPDEAQRRAAQIEWEYAQTVVREHTWVQGLATALGLTDTHLDNLFAAAAAL